MNLKDFDKLVRDKKKELATLEAGIGSLKAKKPTLQKEIDELIDKKIGIKAYLDGREKSLMASVDEKAVKVGEALKLAEVDRDAAAQLRKDAKVLYDKAAKETNATLSDSANAEGRKAEVNAKIGKIKSFAKTVTEFADSL